MAASSRDPFAIDAWSLAYSSMDMHAAFSQAPTAAPKSHMSCRFNILSRPSLIETGEKLSPWTTYHAE